MNGNVTNDGLVKTTIAGVTWNGTFTNNSAYISDLSHQTFVQDLSVTPNGYVQGLAPLLPPERPGLPFTPEDTFTFQGNFINTSTQNVYSPGTNSGWLPTTPRWCSSPARPILINSMSPGRLWGQAASIKLTTLAGIT